MPDGLPHRPPLEPFESIGRAELGYLRDELNRPDRVLLAELERDELRHGSYDDPGDECDRPCCR